MDKPWNVLYYQTEHGVCEIREFFNSRKLEERQKIGAWISLLEEKGPQVPRPYADLLKDGIHELRIKLTGNQVRVLYFFCFRDMVVLTHGFTKTSAQVPADQIKKALKIKAEVIGRFKKREDLYDSFS
jgi:hypothetical protein